MASIVGVNESHTESNEHIYIMLKTSCTCTKANILLCDWRYSVTLPQNPHYNPCSSIISVKVNSVIVHAMKTYGSVEISLCPFLTFGTKLP
jgi:hypothetical protein